MTTVARLFLTLTLGLASVVSTGLSQDQRSDELMALEHSLARAWVDGDREAIDAMLDDDWSVIDITGNVQTKSDIFRAMFGPNAPVVENVEVDELEVRWLAEVAIITGRTRWRAKDGTDLRLRFTDVVTRRDGRWRFIASHGTRIVK